jgi:hypothetical protein
MSFFRRKNQNASLIPPVGPPPGSEPQAAPPSDNGAARNQLFSRGNGSNSPAPRSNAQDPYAPALERAPPSYHTNAGDPYGDGKASDQRNELLGGFQPKADVPKDRKYGYEGREMEDDFDEEEEIEGIKQEMRGLKQESLASSRLVWIAFVVRRRVLIKGCSSILSLRSNAIRIAREAEDTARGTLGRLGDQSGT